MSTHSTATAPNSTTSSNNPWEMTVGAGGSGGDFVACPAGTHPGTIVGIFDIGYQTEFNREKNTEVQTRKIIIVGELVRKKPDGKPFVLAERYTWSMKDNSNFYKMVTTMTGMKFKEGDKFNPLGLNGKPAMFAVSNTQSGDKTYHNISGILQFPEGFPQIDPTHHPVSWSVMTGEPFPTGLDWLPWVYGKTIKDLAEASAEWKKRNGGGTVSAAAAAASPARVGAPANGEDIPF